ncbi:MAG: D-alanyl-D-alanine carboxypeptidase [Hyphomicrobiales bacterium]|nr:D-alanyl-D-alanine carboxypeptidase [Hyphomicrobiales bacterium]
MGIGLPVVSAQIETSAPYAYLFDVETKTVLFEKNSDELMKPASMSKLMTLAIVFEQLKSGKLTLESEFPVSEHAWRTGGAPSGTAAMFAPLNTDISVSDLVQGIAVQSGNDACIIVAEGIAGTDEAFARMMTQYARNIGLEKSTFGNSSGLPHPDQLMTSRELAMLALHLIEEYPEYYHYFGQKEFPYRKHKFYNRNPLVRSNFPSDGLKTGYTKESGYGIVASAVENGRRLILVLNGLESSKMRRAEATRIFNWGFRAFAKFTVFNSDEVVGEALTWGGEKRYVPLRGDGDVRVLLPKDVSKQRLRGEIVYRGPVITPIQEGDEIGYLRVTGDDGIEATAPLYAAESIGRAGIIQQGFDSALTLAFGWLIHDSESNEN